MSNKDNDFGLPVVSKPLLPEKKQAATINTRTAQVELTEHQVDKLIDGGVQVAADVFEIGKGIVEIAKIRERSKAAVDEVDARTRQIVSMMEKRIEAMQEEHQQLKTRGETAVLLVSQLTALVAGIPEADTDARREAIKMIPELAEKTFQSR